MADQAAEAPTPQRGGFRGRGNRGGQRGGARTSNHSPAPQQQAEAAAPPVFTQTIKPTKPVLGKLPAPSRQAENQQRQKTVSTKKDSAFKEAVFGEERRLKPATREVDFTPSSTGYTDLVNDVYLSYKNEKKKQMTKESPVELLRCYCSCMYWLRVLGIKYKTARPLSKQEEVIYQALQYKDYTIPEPIFLALRAIGKVKLTTGETIVPDFPPLPSVVVVDN